MQIENLSTLKIHKLTQTQYDRELAKGSLDKNALYLTPDEQTVQATDAILYIEQTLTEEQKEQARANIGAVADSFFSFVESDVGTEYTSIMPEESAFTEGKYCNPETGNITNNANYRFTEGYIAVPAGARLLVHFKESTTKEYYPIVIYYDANQNYIGGEYGAGLPQEDYEEKLCAFYNVPEDAWYIRMTLHTTYFNLYGSIYLYAVTSGKEIIGVEIPGLVIPGLDEIREEIGGAVSYTPQNPTSDQQKQAKKNLGIDDSALEVLKITKTGEDGAINVLQPPYTAEGFFAESIILSSGNIGSGASYENYCVTPLIPIEGGKTYAVLTSDGVGYDASGKLATINDGYGLFAEDGTTPVSKVSLTNLGNNIVLIKTPEAAACIRFCICFSNSAANLHRAAVKFNTWFMIDNGTENTTVEDFKASTIQHILGGIVMDKDTVPHEAIQNAAALLNGAIPLAGKTIVNFGDSIFGNSRPPEDISTALANLTGATVKNCAFGGCRMATHVGHWDAFSMYRLAHAIANQDYSLQDDALNYDDRTSYAEAPLGLLKETDFSTVDVVTIAYGTNDWTGNNALDNAENKYDTATVCGALRYSVEALLTAFPQLRIFVLLPTYRFWMDSAGAFTEDSETEVNNHGKTLVEFCQGIADVAAEYNLPIIDNYKQLGINKFNRTLYFPANDGTHHNENGRKLLAAHIAKNLW